MKPGHINRYHDNSPDIIGGSAIKLNTQQIEFKHLFSFPPLARLEDNNFRFNTDALVANSRVINERVELSPHQTNTWSQVTCTHREDGNVHRLFFTKDTKFAEAVVEYMADGSVDFRSPCLSGCGMECDFCGVGQDKFFTVLSAQQILSIMEISLQAAKVPVDAKLQVQFFSTGEPMLSVKPIFEAIRQIYQANNNRLNEIVISTSAPQAKYESANNRGEYSHLIALGEEIPVLFLQLSIQINDETRNARIHRPNKLSLDQMSEIGATFHERTNRKPIVNLVADPDHSSHEELSNVVRIFPPTHFNVKVSTLSGETKAGAITPGEAKALDMLQEGHQTDFSNTLGAARFFKSQGYERVLIFDPLGRDEKNMQSGCGDFPDAGEAHSRLAEGRRRS